MKILLAPMEGVVDHHMRQTLFGIKPEQKTGLDLCVTEFVRVTDHTLPDKVFHRICPEILSSNSYPIRVQLLGSNPEALASNAKKVAAMDVAGVDLNFGCPAKTVNKSRGGACLLDESDLIYEIVASVRNAVPPQIPVTAKIRLGYQQRDSYMKNAQLIEKAGADEIVVHARSKADGYHPPAYWECIGEIRRLLKIPVVANGEVWTVGDYDKCRLESGCDDVMLGRGLLARPDLGLAIKAHIAGQKYALFEWNELLPYVSRFFETTCHAYPEKYLGNRLKQWLHYLRRTYAQADTLFEAIKSSRDQKTISAAIKRSAIY